MSKQREDKVVVFQHKHCRYCGGAVSSSKEFCSPECESELRRVSRRRTYMSIIMLVPLPIILILMLMYSK